MDQANENLFDQKRAQRREHLLTKLRQVFRDGYRPARGNESYDVMLANGVKTYSMVNCLGHIFNLRNQQFNDYNFHSYNLYGCFNNLEYFTKLTNRTATSMMLEFIRETGLKVEECDPNKAITDFKSWKIALYFGNNDIRRDFHYLLQETPQMWTSKLGYSREVERLVTPLPPEEYATEIFNYELYGTYQITNPHADPNNRYVKGNYTPERGM